MGENPNYVLVRRFLRSAVMLLSENGCIAITAVKSPHYDGVFAMSDAAEWAGVSEPRVHPFHFHNYPGYRHGNTEDDGESAVSAKEDSPDICFFETCMTANDRVGTQQLLTGRNALPPGATYMPDFVAPAMEALLVRQIGAAPWITELKRRVQHYGYRYDYRARTVTEDAYLGPLPDWLMALGTRLKNAGWFAQIPDQVIVNEYQPGQGIAAHIDCVPCFSGTIASLSLLSSCAMRFEERSSGDGLTLTLQPRSLLVLQGPARFDWTHAIPARKSDVIHGRRVPRGRRLSLTFRNVIVA